MSMGSGIAYASFWFGLFGTVCWFLWLVHLGEVQKINARQRKSTTQEQK